MDFNLEIFKANDIRGVYSKDFDEDFAFKLGAVLVRYLSRRQFLVANDNRSFSPNLAEAIIAGLVSAGADVKYLDLATTPFFNFVFKNLSVDGGIMVTASHNPPEYGGFKVFGESGRMIGLEYGLKDIRSLIEQKSEISKYGGRRERLNKEELLNKFVNFVIKLGGASKSAFDTIKIGLSYPKIAEEEVRLLLKRLDIEVNTNNPDIIFSFDADADRIVVKDGGGNLVASDFITGVLVQCEKRLWFKPRVVYDLRFSRGVKEKFQEWGIKTFRSQVGRAFLRDNAVRYKADISGELSGHIYFKKTNYNEMPLLTMLRILKIMAKTSRGINELTQPFKTWFNSGEINIATGDLGLGTREIIEKLKNKYPDGKTDNLDGLTIEYPSWWFNLRPSNTEPLLRLVVEAKTSELLENRVKEIIDEINKK